MGFQETFIKPRKKEIEGLFPGHPTQTSFSRSQAGSVLFKRKWSMLIVSGLKPHALPWNRKQNQLHLHHDLREQSNCTRGNIIVPGE